MIVKVLIENTAQSDGILTEHGLSFYIETKMHRILFDMGQSDAFIQNASTIGVDLSEVDIAFLSHGHYDHGGGLEAFLSINSDAKVYINKNAFEDYYSEDGRYIGLNKNLRSNKRIIFTEDEQRIDNELYIFTGNKLKRNHYMDTFSLFKEQGGKRVPDDFLHEQYLIINDEQKNILISGCSHKGILNIMDWVKEYNVGAVFGGFHYMKVDIEKDHEYLYDTSKKLLEHRTKYYTCHCTGIEQYNHMKDLMCECLEYVSAGKIINL